MGRKIHPLVDELRKIRKLEGVSQCELAARVGYCRGVLNAIETGRRMPRDIKMLVDWAQSLGWDIALVPKQRNL